MARERRWCKGTVVLVHAGSEKSQPCPMFKKRFLRENSKDGSQTTRISEERHSSNRELRLQPSQNDELEILDGLFNSDPFSISSKSPSILSSFGPSPLADENCFH
jgi:hypothetical protein